MMITEKELLDAIEECKRDPITYNSIEKLANLYTVKHYLFSEGETITTHRQTEKVIISGGDSEFLQTVDGMNAKRVWAVMDELMSVIKVTNEKLYDGVMRKLFE